MVRDIGAASQRQRSTNQPSAESGSHTEARPNARDERSTWLLAEGFRPLERLGEGGMGVVHRVLDRSGREVALKSLTSPNPEDFFRLKREFRVLAALRHPNIIPVYELFAGRGTALFTMALVHGQDVRKFVNDTAASGRRCNYLRLRLVAQQLASALAAVHGAGILHRDIKPSNVKVTPEGRVVLFDFGLADRLSPKTKKTQATGMLFGTSAYASPEQCRGEALGEAADWYGLGATLFEAATGKLPVDDISKKLTAGRVPCGHIRAHLPDAPAELDELIAALLHPVPSRRPEAKEILRILGARSSQEFDHVRQDDVGTQGAWVLRGRCRAVEKVAFNALDEVIDELSEQLVRLPRAELASILPAHAAALPRLFPVLGRLEIALGDRSMCMSTGEPDARFARAALKELLASVARRRPLVVWIDDVHLADRESGELLVELLRPLDGAPASFDPSWAPGRMDRPATLLGTLGAS